MGKGSMVGIGIGEWERAGWKGKYQMSGQQAGWVGKGEVGEGWMNE